MTVEKLIDLINDTSAEKTHLEQFFNDSIKDSSVTKLVINTDDTEEIKKHISELEDSKKTAFGNKLSVLENICSEKEIAAKEFNAKDYINCVNKIKTLIHKLIELYEYTMKHEAALLAEAKNAKTAERGDVSRMGNSINDLKIDINRANSDIQRISDDLKDQIQIFDSKVFQVLLNTVTLLGIFVAIAFTGFGSITIFTNIDIDTWMKNTEIFIRNTFVLMLTSFLAYNLLLLLVYFVYKLSRPLICINSKNNKNKEINLEKEPRFYNEMNLSPFIWIDVGLFTLVVALFIWCTFLL